MHRQIICRIFESGVIVFLLIIVTIILSTCGRHVNSIGDSHFAEDGSPLDTVNTLFVPTKPESVKLYIESSGSMNGFFCANRANKFKKTVNSVFSGLKSLSDGFVYTMSEGGGIDRQLSLDDFKNKMNEGSLVSTSSTQIPEMLKTILASIDSAKQDIAVLVSDMKFSPMGKTAAPALIEYQEDIRDIIASHPQVSISFVCAKSEYISKNGSVIEENSPYFFLIIGASDNVASLRNDISRWCEATDSFIESGDMAMNYHTPVYSIEDVNNGEISKEYPQTLITTFDCAVSDTCSFILRVNMNGYPWKAVNADILKECFTASTVYGSSIEYELLTGDKHLVDDHAYKGDFKRHSYADYLIKLYNFSFDDEVIEWTFTNRPFDGLYKTDFINLISVDNENDLSGAFSFDKFIEGCFNARLNTSDDTSVRILVSSYQ